jgi:hypothetical protein
MFAEWSAECSADDPVLVVPWKDPNTPAHFIDLRSDPYELYAIPEAENHPPLTQALRALNATRSPVFTAKCDIWTLEEEDLRALRFNLDLAEDLAAVGFASYIDLIWRDRRIFTSTHSMQQLLDRLVRLAASMPGPLVALELVMRPALVDFGDPQEGYALSMYVKAVGSDTTHATEEWGRALGEVVRLLRGRDFASR